MASAIEKVLEIAATNAFDNDSVQTCLDAVKDLSANIDLLIGGAPEHLDTIKELADALDNSGNLATNIIAKIDDINEKVSQSGGGGLDERPQWDLFTTVSLNNVISKYSNFSDDVGNGTQKYNNFGEGAMAMNDRYFVTAKSHGGNDIWSFRNNSYGGQWQSWHRIPISGNKNVAHTKFGIEFFDTHRFYYGQPGYQDANNNYKGNVVLYNLGANPATLDNTLFPESDLSNNAWFGKGIAIDGNFLVVTADGNDTMGNDSGSIFIYKKDANGDFINHDTSYNIIHGDISSGPKKLGNGGLIAIKGDYFCTGGNHNGKGAVIVYKKDANDDWSQHTIIFPYYDNNGNSINYDIASDIRMTSDSIITTERSGFSLQIFNYDGTLKQHFNTNSSDLKRNSIMFASTEYIITGESADSEYNPTLYKYSDPSWNTVSNVADFLPINLEPNNASSRYGKFSAQYNNDLVFSQTFVDGTGNQHGALYSLKYSTDEVSYINTKSFEGENLITKSIKFIDNEIPLQNQDGTKIPASKLINIDDDISCNLITVKNLEEFDPKLIFTHTNTVPGYSNLGNTKDESIKLYKNFALLGFQDAQYSNSQGGIVRTGNYGAVVIMKKNGVKWERHQTLTPFLGTSAFNTSTNTNNQTNFHNGEFGRTVDMNDNYIVAGFVGNNDGKGGIKLYKKNSNGLFFPVDSSYFNYGTGTTSSSLVIGQSDADAMKGYGNNANWTWRDGNNSDVVSVKNTLAITEDNLIIVSESNGTTTDIHMFVFYINKNVSTTGLEDYKWDLIRIDTSDLDSNTGRIGKIIHYGNSIVFCSANGNTNDNYSFLYRYSYTVDSNGKPTFTYEQTFTEWGGVGFALTQNDDFVFLASPIYEINTSQNSQLHIYEKSTDESLSLLHTFTYNGYIKGIQVAATNKRLYLTSVSYSTSDPDDTVHVYKYDPTYEQSNKIVYWKHVSNDQYKFDMGQSSDDKFHQYNYFQTNGVDILIGRYNQKPKLYSLSKELLKDVNDNTIFELQKNVSNPDSSVIHLGDSKTTSLDSDTITTNKITLNNTILESLDNRLTVSSDISCNKLIGDIDSNIITTNKIITGQINDLITFGNDLITFGNDISVNKINLNSKLIEVVGDTILTNSDVSCNKLISDIITVSTINADNNSNLITFENDISVNKIESAIGVFGNIDTGSAEFTDIKISGQPINKIYARETSSNTEQVYYENFSGEDLTLHAESEANYKEGYFVDSKALNTIGRTPEGLQWVQDLPSGSKSLSFWLKIPDQTGDQIILDTRDSSGNGYITIFYKDEKMYISANGNTSKYSAKILVDNTAVTVGDEFYKMKQLGSGDYLKDNLWHHWFIELAENDNTEKITWFSRNTSGLLITNPEKWTEKQIYNPADENTFSGLGGIMDIYGDYMVLGLPNRDTFDDNNTATTTDSGMVRILKKENNVWGKIKDISSNPSDLEYRKFGFSVSIHGDYLVVGDHSDDNADSNAGAIYIYKKNEGGTDNWGQIKKIVYPVEYDGNFGFSVKIYGDYIAVSAVRESNNVYNGAIYVYKKDYDPDDVNTPSTDNWGQLKKLTPFGTDFDNGTINNSIQLGVGLEMDDNYIIGGSRRERAYIWKKDEGGVDNWGEIKVLQGSETVDMYDSYSTSSSNQANTAGESIAIDGDYIIIAARGDQGRSNDTGKVYVYKNNNDSWDEIKILTYETPYSGDQFGRGLSIKDGIIAIGAPREDTPSSNCGSVTLFYKDEGGIDNWGQIKKLTASDAQSDDEFGRNVIMQSGTIVVGAPLAESPSDSGAIYFFENSSFITTSLFNIEARISEYRIFNTSLTTEQITDLYNGNDGNFKNKTISIDDNVSTKKLLTDRITLDGVDLTKIVQTDSSTNHSGQTYYENFDDEDVTIHTDSEVTYVTGRNGTGKALNTIGVTPDGLQWVQTLPTNSKSFSFWLKIPEQSVPVDSLFDKYIFDGRDSGNNGYLTAFYKNNKMYILPTDNNKNKFPSKILIDGVAATISSEWTDDLGRQVGTGKYLQDNKWHHWLIELSEVDSIAELTWFSRFEIADNENSAAWNEIKKVIHSEHTTISSGSYFGNSIAIDGDYMVAGCPRRNAGQQQSVGGAFIFKKDEGGTENWGEIKTLEHSDYPTYPSSSGQSHHFGQSVSMSGDYIVIGAYMFGPPSQTPDIYRAGAAYVFKKDEGGTGNWGEIKKLTASDEVRDAHFGWSVLIDNDHIFIGAYGQTTSNMTGAVYIFKKDEGGTDNWGQFLKLTNSVNGSQFGRSLAIDNDYLVVGANYEGSHAGAIYIFNKDYDPLTPNDISSNAWGELKKIVPSDIENYDKFGESVAINGDYIVVGSLKGDAGATNSGGAYIFKKDQGGTDNWGQIKKITAIGIDDNDDFGQSVSINDDYLVIGAPGDDDLYTNTGSIYIFGKNLGGSDNWGQITKLNASTPINSSDIYGTCVLISNNYLFVGAPGYRGSSGASYQNSTGLVFIYRNDTFDRTTFFNLEAVMDDYRIFNKRLTNAEIADLTAGGNANILGEAIVMDRIDVNDISCAALTVNGVSITQNGGGGGGTTLSVDTISESTTATGVTIDSVLLKDNKVTAHTVTAQNYAVGSVNFISASRQGNFRDLEVKNSSNTETILLTGDGGNISIDGTLSADTIGEKTSAAGVTIDSVLLKDNNVTAHTVTAQNYAVGSVNFISASRQGNFRDLEVKDSNNSATILLTGDGGEMSLEGTLTVDTINEKTTDSGVTIEGVLMRDGGATFTGDISANDASLNVVNIAALKVNGVSITQNGSGGASLNVNSDISINAIDAVDASFNVLRTSGTMAMGGHILPTSNATYDLGSAEYKIRHLFLSDNSLWLGDQHKIDVDSGKIKFKKRKTGTGFVPKEILDASANSTATQHLDGVIAEFGDVTTVDDIKLYHWEAWVADTAKSGVTDLLPHQLFLNDDNFVENDEVGTAIKLPVKEDAGAPSTTPAVGTMTYNSSDKKLYIYSGAGEGEGWKSFSPDA